MHAAVAGVQQVITAPCRKAFAPIVPGTCRCNKVRCYATSSEERPKVSRPLQSTEEERQRRPSKHEILNVAEHDLEGFCSALPDDEDAQECWDAYRYYEDKRHEAEEACELEWEKNDGLSQPQCARLEKFENFVRQSVGEGHIVHFISTLQSLSHAEQRRLARELGEDGKDSSQSSVSEAAHKVQESLETSTVGVGDTEEDASRRRHRVRELFQAMDKDHNGKLDVGEFRDAMRELGDDMSGTTVATILDAMDVHGFISLDQFVAIVEAEAIESHSSDARMLRRLSKDPVWWTKSIDRV